LPSDNDIGDQQLRPLLSKIWHVRRDEQLVARNRRVLGESPARRLRLKRLGQAMIPAIGGDVSRPDRLVVAQPAALQQPVGALRVDALLLGVGMVREPG